MGSRTAKRILSSCLHLRRIMSNTYWGACNVYVAPWGDVFKTRAAAEQAHGLDLDGNAPDGGGIDGVYPRVKLVMSRGGAPNPDGSDRLSAPRVMISVAPPTELTIAKEGSDREVASRVVERVRGLSDDYSDNDFVIAKKVKRRNK
eukprot:scaffold242520_cov36-Tisochrysis_lutea.AAC.2